MPVVLIFYGPQGGNVLTPVAQAISSPNTTPTTYCLLYSDILEVQGCDGTCKMPPDIQAANCGVLQLPKNSTVEF